MELRAVISGLRAVEAHEADAVVVTTDSQYVRQGITAWIHGWKRNGWMTKARTPVKNAELWRELDEVNARITPEWRWVKGHSGDEHNEACDGMVQAAIAAGTA
jgi:ribonuclease HI